MKKILTLLTVALNIQTITDIAICANFTNSLNKTKQTNDVYANGLNMDSPKFARLSGKSLDDLVSAIAAVESGNNPAAVGDKGRAAGILQIHQPVLLDVNRRYGTCYEWPRDAFNPHHARNICRLYLRMTCPKNASAEQLCRTWNGGKRGWKRNATLAYWGKVQKLL